MILRLFGKASAGRCLSAVKKEWGCVGENLSKTPGEHLYKTVDGDTVSMIAGDKCFEIKRHIAPENMEKFNAGGYKGKLFKIISDIQNWYNMKEGNGFIFFKKFRLTHKFANQDEKLLKKTKPTDTSGYKQDEKTGIIAEFVKNTKLWKILRYKNHKLVKTEQ